jgi:hypothetical protein
MPGDVCSLGLLKDGPVIDTGMSRVGSRCTPASRPHVTATAAMVTRVQR